MERRIFETTLGPLWLWGEPWAFQGERPLVLVIRGAMARADDLEWLTLADHDLVFAHLPGFHSPMLAANSVGTFIFAFDAAIRGAFPQRRITVLGSSAGAIVAAGLRAPQLVARVLVEPFFSTGKLAPLAAMLRGQMPVTTEPYRRWIWDILGISSEAIEDRHYEHLLIPDLPIHAVVGDIPLAQPVTGGLPSLTDEADRALLRAAGADLRVAPGGHDLPNMAPKAIAEALRDATRNPG
jgi:hypothetical protein